MFKVNINDKKTISSLALYIYRSNFMPDEAKISITHKSLYDKLIEGYYGGAVDVYKPYHDGKVYCYDVNSLYPSVMLNNDMPVGSPLFVNGNIDLHDSKTFGFLKVKVTTPDNLYMPLLHTKINNMGVAPVGEFTGWYFTEELKYAEKLGYKFEILEAHSYSKEYIFKDFVKHFFKIKRESKGADRYLAKLTLISLYGIVW